MPRLDNEHHNNENLVVLLIPKEGYKKDPTVDGDCLENI